MKYPHTKEFNQLRAALRKGEQQRKYLERQIQKQQKKRAQQNI